MEELRHSLEEANTLAFSELREELESRHQEEEKRMEEEAAAQLLQLRTALEEEKEVNLVSQS